MMASQDVPTKSDEADLRSATPQAQAKFQEAGLPSSRPPTSGTIVNHDEEKGIDSPKVPLDDGAFTIPDGGLRAWSVVFGCFLILFSTFGYVSVIVLSKLITSEQQIARSMLSAFTSHIIHNTSVKRIQIYPG